MLKQIPKEILGQMLRLEKIDARDRIDGTAHLDRLRQIPQETGKFLAILAASAPKGVFVEIGTSAGYSALYIALACRETGSRLITFETLEKKARLARETFRLAEVEDVVKLVHGDVREYSGSMREIAFCFMDAEKDSYLELYDFIIPKMVKGGILAADNVISHADMLGPFTDYVSDDGRVDSVIVPIGKGELICRKR